LRSLTKQEIGDKPVAAQERLDEQGMNDDEWEKENGDEDKEEGDSEPKFTGLSEYETKDCRLPSLSLLSSPPISVLLLPQILVASAAKIPLSFPHLPMPTFRNRTPPVLSRFLRRAQ